MRKTIAQQRYQQRHIETDLPRLTCDQPLWQYALVIPVYRESAQLITTLQELAANTEPFVAILVINRPDSDGDQQANDALRSALSTMPAASQATPTARLHEIGGSSALLLHDTEALRGPLPADKGVGLARKIGCDLAWQWISDRVVEHGWIFSSDADARLPTDYFQRVADCPSGSVAATYPFLHVPGPDPVCNEATSLYELRLHHYVLGLEFASSPYAYHTLGSSLAIEAEAYAKVRGFPQRAGGEDFYLLNKLRKIGPVERLRGQCIELASRQSHRVPFGTGPAVARIADEAEPPALFYHPQCFLALRALLREVDQGVTQTLKDLPDRLQSQGLQPELARQCASALDKLGWEVAVEHCQRQAGNHDGFLRHFHQWFDGFRTLKFIHAIRDKDLPQQTLSALASQVPNVWPHRRDSETLADAVRAHWNWTTTSP